MKNGKKGLFFGLKEAKTAKKAALGESFLGQVWAVFKEKWLTKRALRLLSKQEWSVDFLTSLLIKASNTLHKPLEMTIIGPSGTKLKINTYDTRQDAVRYKDDSIFNHLDDELRVQQFIREVNGR